MTTDTCSLCDQALPRFSIADDSYRFCCSGCHAVFQILSNKNELDNFQQHPLFLQALSAGLISNPALLEQIRLNRPELATGELEKLHLEIQDMWCPSCAEVIRLMLLREKGVRNCVVDYATDLASIEYSPRYLSKDKLLSIIRSLGYQPLTFDDGSRIALRNSHTIRFIVAAFCALNIMMFAYPLYAIYFDPTDEGMGMLLAWISLATTLPVVTYCAWPIFKRCWTSLLVGILGMEALVVLGISTAFGISLYEMYGGGTQVYFDSLSVLVALVLLGKMIESKAKFSAKDSMLWLARTMPRRARKRFSDGQVSFVPIKDLVAGDVIQVLMGEKVPVDGVVVSGDGVCDESMMTGESVPIAKTSGSQVLAGTLLQQGYLDIHIRGSFEENTLHQIIAMIEKDLSRKVVYFRAVDKVVAWFVPAVILIAILTAAYGFLFANAETAMLSAISVLLISCPCAIGIAAPLAEARILNSMARLGAIVRNRACLPMLGRETTFVFDKTGTITEGYFHVLSGLKDLSPHDLAVLKTFGGHSTHLIAIAVARSIATESISGLQMEEIAGKGIRGQMGDDVYLLGSEALMQQHGLDITPIETMHTPVYFAKNGRLLTTLILGDRIRNDASALLQSLDGIQTLLLSGDAQQSVEQVAKECGFHEWKWRQNPLQKRACIDHLREQGKTVAMLGDGINDALALAGANIGISIVTATDVSIQVSDILLTTDQLTVIHKIRQLAQQGQKIIKQNLFWVFFYNIVGIGLAICGLLTPLFAAVAMTLSSLMVLVNAQRIR